MEVEDAQRAETAVPESDGKPPYTIRITLEVSKVQPGSGEDRDYQPVAIFGVEIENVPEGGRKSSWAEGFSTPGEVYAFLRGVQAGAQMTGGPYLQVPGIRGILL
ncbi:MAG: hypothetical protein HY978_01880 [Candidatus Liptonbacteria bacterium]|nr:hypothetical protein [Candidatus Liptonbacteria bacterium]